MARKFDPAKKAQKWTQSMQNAGPAYADGIRSVTDNPMQAAADQQATAVARYTAALQSGAWANSLRAVPMAQWQQTSATVGAQNLVNGVAKGQPKMQRYLQAAAPIYQEISAQIRAMPNATDQDRRNRMLANFDLMKTRLKGVGKG